MNKPKIILIGAGGHCHSCIDVIEQQGKYDIAGLIGMPDEINSQVLGYKVIGSDSDLPRIAEEYQYALITVGQISSPHCRIRLYEYAASLGLQFPVIVSPYAHVARGVPIGPGTIVMHGAIINSGSSIGENCLINSRALIEHDVTVHAHCHISTGAILNGNVSVGWGSFVGSGSIVKEGLQLGHECLIGMGVSVRHNVLDRSKCVGSGKI
ncbi:acetyltransferase [Geothrix limicola]|uniref:Acetyltransferase n=1 Tax=Geothrix limicola TaxID=2927978 RepID=A0ABQ5QF39_9BACT|nr:acetyltransferase [Geothrix limicola]GLH73050.1 acetyltransferase [Geothrix limicola]